MTSIIAWKGRYNTKKEITVYRYVVRHNGLYHDIRFHVLPDREELPYGATIKVLDIKDDNAAFEYAKNMKGRHLYMPDEEVKVGRSYDLSNAKPMLYLKLYFEDPEDAEQQEQVLTSRSKNYDTYDFEVPFELPEVDFSIDTASELNLSGCSGDTEYNVTYDILDEFSKLLPSNCFDEEGLKDNIQDQIHVLNMIDTLYQEQISYYKAIEKMERVKTYLEAYKKGINDVLNISNTYIPDPIKQLIIETSSTVPTIEELRNQRISRWQEYAKEIECDE